MNDALTRIGWVAYVNLAAIVPFAFVTWFTYYVACKTLKVAPHDSHSDANFWLTGVATGITERFFFAFGIALNVSGIGTAMIIWTVLKAQSHWQVFSKTTTKDGGKLEGIKEIYLGILFSMLSMLWAMIIGYSASGKPWPNGWLPF